MLSSVSCGHVWRPVLFSVLFLVAGPFQVAADQTIAFSWAVFIDTPQGQRVLDFLQPKKLANGAKIQIFLEQQPGVFLYLYLVDSSGTLELLFPEKIDSSNHTHPDNSIIRIPPGAARFTLTPPSGEEKLYLMASADRLKQLEVRTAEYLRQKADKRKKAAVLQEMKRLRRTFSHLDQVTSTSVPVAGTIRSGKQSEERFKVTKVEADSFYSRILVIRHE